MRRVYTAKKGDPAAIGTGWRSVTTVATGERATLARELAGMPAYELGTLDIPRVWLHRAAAPYPSAEQLLVVAPVGVADKQRPGFPALWNRVAVHPQLELFPLTATGVAAPRQRL